MKINTKRAIEIIKENKGKIFTASFIKKNGEMRKINARLGVKKQIKGVGMAYNPELKGLLTVYDMQKKSYRMLNVNTLLTLNINSVKYEVK